MFRITMKNLQCIGEAVIEFDNQSIIEFTGDNSNGKSVLSKTLDVILSGEVRDKTTRKELINDNCEEAFLSIQYETRILLVRLHVEVSQSYIAYYPNSNDLQKCYARPLGDWDGCKILIDKFGFKTYASGSISLQVMPTWGAIPFITTNGAVNYEIVDDITRDKVAEEFLAAFQNYTYPTFRQLIANKQQQLDMSKTVLESIVDYDVEGLDTAIKEMRDIYEVISHISYLNLENVPIPDISIIELSPLELIAPPIVEAVPMFPNLEPIGKELDDLLDILNGVCPTCGKPLI